MASLTDHQLELLQRARDGLPMWGGSMATARLRRDVDLLLALRLVEPAADIPYRVTALGEHLLACEHPLLANYARARPGG